MSKFVDISLDLRSLAIFRILLALWILVDLVERSLVFQDHYSPDGLVGASLVSSWTIHLGPAWWAALLFIIHFIVALALGLGWRTRTMGILNWVLLVSLHHRNPNVLYGADAWVALSSLWSIFLPLGRVWSYDSRKQDAPDSFKIKHPLAWLWIAQIALVYFITAAKKTGVEWSDGYALYNSCFSFQYRGFLGQQLADFLAAFPGLGKMGSWSIVAWELSVGPVLFSRWRRFAIFSILFFHFTIFLTMRVGLFPGISMALAISLLPSRAWSGGESPQTMACKLDQRVVAVTSLLFLFSASIGVLSINRDFRKRSKTHIYPLIDALRIEQRWNMFAPSPPTKHGWYSARATLSDGSTRELLDYDSKEFSDKIPPSMPNFGSIRWRMFCFVSYTTNYKRLRPVLVGFLKREWQKRHPQQSLSKIELIYFSTEIVPFQELPFEERVIYEEDVRF